jgi:hypothetical protein
LLSVPFNFDGASSSRVFFSPHPHAIAATHRCDAGETVRVTVPQGISAGQTFEFEYGGSAVPPPRPPRPPPAAAGAQLMRVQVPPNSGPGASLTVNVPGRGAHRVTVPPNVRAGQYFQFRVH